MQYGYRYISLSLAFILALFVLNRMKLEQVKIALSSFLEVSQGRALRAPGRAPLFWGCSSADRGVTFTFDDGPGKYTAKLLDVLKELGIRATFFVCGNAALRSPDLVKRMVAEGHEVGSHTFSHQNLTHLMVSGDLKALEEEIVGNEEVILNLTGQRPRLLRPPYGAINADVLQYLGQRGYEGVVMWSGGCIDWFFHDYQKELPVYINGMADAGALLCFHDNNDAENLLSHFREFVSLLRVASPQTTINPQGRPIISMPECLELQVA